jgi:hypothetical protein
MHILQAVGQVKDVVVIFFSREFIAGEVARCQWDIVTDDYLPVLYTWVYFQRLGMRHPPAQR